MRTTTRVSFIALLFCGWICVAVPMSGCSSTSKTTTTETTSYAPSDERVTTTERTETKEEDEHHGILSSTVSVIGDILALPFRAVAGLINLIF